jgi:hypothetical protein
MGRWGMSERYLEAERALEIAEKVTIVFSHAISLFLIFSMFGDLVGVPVSELIWRVVSVPWVIPVEIIVEYYYVWYTMYCLLFVLMVVDYFVYVRYMHRKMVPPVTYARYMSLAIFLLSVWLALLFKTTTLILIAVFSSLSLMYTTLRRG